MTPLGKSARRRTLFWGDEQMRRKWWIILAVLAALLLAAAALDMRMIVRRYELDAPEITAPVRLAVLTDFHGCDYGENAGQLMQAVEAELPDAVLLVGDIFDDDMPWDASAALVRSLAARWPCYYVTGNHEYWSEQVGEICRIVTEAGAMVLDQKCAAVEINGQHISLCGVPDPYAMVYEDAPDTEVQLTQTIAQAEAGTFTLLMAHRPELIDKYAAAGFDLVVAGHAHGGQVRIPGLVNGLYAPNQGFLPAYAGGEYRVGETTLIVSRGLARESTRMPRIFNRPELVIVELK